MNEGVKKEGNVYYGGRFGGKGRAQEAKKSGAGEELYVSDFEVTKMAHELVLEARGTMLARATRIERYLGENGIIRDYLKKRGVENIQSVPEVQVAAARERWKNLSDNDLISAALGFEDKCEEDPMAYLELARALRKRAAEKTSVTEE